ncbi:uncharacterized protein LOC124447545 [Xenia sp. Carnegie-2017]|uniref:uncharacterized protein LOC124447545 n=1 Tax=Xenia sp. Carnegie-2017 TaxID=2897299 RepID=UPI001F042D93|nr:uncharacterized protein LOC124447545 [Xenia sp. Carnegie-2017]
MICIILVAGHGTKLENEIKNDPSGKFNHLQGVPKALLPGVGGKKILDFWWDAINVRQYFSAVYLVTNADKYKHYERWATAHDFPMENIVNDGSTTFQSRLGSVADFELVLRNKNINSDVLVVAGDMLFQDQKFDICQVINYFKTKKGELAIYYEMDESESTRTRGIIEVCPTSNRIVKFLEKPEPHETKSRLASVVFYCLRKDILYTVEEFLKNNQKPEERVFGRYMEWLVKKTPVFGMKLPTGFQLIGKVGLSDYQRWVAYFANMRSQLVRHSFTSRVYARVGLVGNPSDGFYGKTIALSISNFWAEVSISESEKLVLVPHPLNDPTEFGSLGDLHGISRKEGYFGGLRLLQATCKKFYQFCSDHGIALAKRNFTLSYDTNIPRQVGLAGSSAIVTATLRCLMDFFNLNDLDLEKPIQPQFILNVEKDELFINAGLQDRVIQVYEGLVYMDFDKEIIKKQGYGNYVNLPVDVIPKLWLAYVTDPSDSGKIHSNVRQKWEQGDEEVIAAMKTFSEYTDKARVALENHDMSSLAQIMNSNFNLRRKIYGDAALGDSNLQMVELARKYGSAAKFPGSGGAVIGLCLDETHKDDLKKAFQGEGFVFCDIIPYLGEKIH